MSILIKNARVLTMANEGEILENSNIYINDMGVIEKVGDTGEMHADNVIDAKHKLVMPGLYNNHSHIAMTLFRNYADDVDLNTWLFKKIFPMEDKLTDEKVYWGSLLGVIEMIKTGTVCFTDQYFFNDNTARVVEESGIKSNMARSCSFDGPMEGLSTHKGYNESLKFFKEWNGKGDGRIKFSISPHSIYTCTGEFIKKEVETAKELGAIFQIHLAETKKEFDDCMEKYGCTPTEYCEKLGIFEVPTILAHCVHMTDNDLDILAKYKDTTSPVHNPSSNLKLASGVARVPEMLKRGITVTLGTDGPASNNKLDMFEEMRLAGLLHKGVTCNPEVVSAYEVLKMATVDGARVAGFKDSGMIKEGMKADIIIVDTNRVNYMPHHNIISALVYSANGLDVETMIVNGKIIMENREIKTLDEEKIFHSAIAFFNEK